MAKGKKPGAPAPGRRAGDRTTREPGEGTRRGRPEAKPAAAKAGADKRRGLRLVPPPPPDDASAPFDGEEAEAPRPPRRGPRPEPQGRPGPASKKKDAGAEPLEADAFEIIDEDFDPHELELDLPPDQPPEEIADEAATLAAKAMAAAAKRPAFRKPPTKKTPAKKPSGLAAPDKVG